MSFLPFMSRLRFCGAVAALLIGAVASPSRAGLIVTVQDSTAAAGGVSAFDVTLYNSGPVGVDVGGFQVELSVPGVSGILFTAATRATAATYLFAAAPGPDPLNSDVLNPFPNTDFIGTDSYFAAPGFQTIGSGDTLGLMHVVYSVDLSTTSGPIAVTVMPYDPSGGGGTLLTDVNGAGIDASLINGTIHVTRAVPEPSTCIMLSAGLLCMTVYHGRRSRRRNG